MVVVGQLIHGGQYGGGLHAAHVVAHGVEKVLAVPPQLPAEAVAVLLHSGQKPGKGLHERVVVHHRIPLVSLQPGSRVAVVLRQNQGVGIDLLDRAAELAPKLVVVLRRMAQVRRHVQAPAVHTEGRRYPAAGDIQYILHQLRRALIVQLRQRVVAPPAVVGLVSRPCAVLLIVKLEKAAVRTVLGEKSPRLVAALAGVNLFSVQPFVEGAAVVEHAVQNHPHPAPVNLPDKLRKEAVAGFQVSRRRRADHILFRLAVVHGVLLHQPVLILHNHPEMGINVLVILNVVLVVGGRHKDGV